MNKESRLKEIDKTKEKLKLSILTFKDRSDLEAHLKSLEADN